MNTEQSERLEQTEARMVQWMNGVSLKDRMLSAEPWERIGIESVSDVMKWNQLKWLGHVLHKYDDDWVKKSILHEVKSMRGRGRLIMTCSQIMREHGL